MRVKITLACQDCKQRNYNMTKDKKTHPDRMETKTRSIQYTRKQNSSGPVKEDWFNGKK